MGSGAVLTSIPDIKGAPIIIFSEDDTLLCSLDRVFDDATVFMIKGDSYRGRKLETLGLEAGIAKHTEFKNA